MNYTKAPHHPDAWATATREKGTREPLVFGKPDQEPVRDPGIDPCLPLRAGSVPRRPGQSKMNYLRDRPKHENRAIPKVLRPGAARA
jgi:hypothetical protein